MSEASDKPSTRVIEPVSRAISNTAPAGQAVIESGPKPALRRCSRCGDEVSSNNNFCGTCGYNLTGTSDGLAYRDPLIGVVVGERYRLLSRIGVGGMGSVYRAEHVRMGKVVAVKILHGDLSRDEGMIRRFTREARAASRLSNRHTVSVFDYGQSEGLIYLVMEFLQGQDLGQILRARGKLDLPQTTRIVAQVAESLTEAHHEGIIHRDLKPENIFVCAPTPDRQGEIVKVLDFGLAKVALVREESLIDSAQGSIIGTPHYMSPEQIVGKEVDVRSDVYSLAALTYKMLTGQPPFPHESPVAVLGRHLNSPPPVPGDLVPEACPADPVIRKGLAKAPEDRYQTMTALADDLIRATETGQANITPVRLAPLPLAVSDVLAVGTREDFARWEGRTRLARVAKAITALAVIAVAAYAFWWGVIQKSLPAESETEPNDDANLASALLLGNSIRGHIGTPPPGERADVDFYRVENSSEQPVVARIEVTGVPELDLVVKAYDLNGHELLSVDSGGAGEPETIPNLAVFGRYFYVQVREYWVEFQAAGENNQVAYQLSVTGRPPERNEEQEPNQRADNALSVSWDTRIRGYVGWEGDRDLFAPPFIAETGTMLTIRVEGANDLDLALVLYNAANQPMLRWDRAGIGRGEHLEVFAAPDDDEGLFIGVQANTSDGPGSDEPYFLEISQAAIPRLQPPAMSRD